MPSEDGARTDLPAPPAPTALAEWRPTLYELIHFNVVDHAILRTIWHNFSEVAPGVFRSNHPSPARFARYKRMGIRSVLNLRGRGGAPQHRIEEAACARLGLELVPVRMLSRAAPSRENLQQLFAALRSAPRPMLMHCKSGADRTGLAAALYLIAFEGRSVPEARRQLGLRYLHVKQSKTGILDHVLDLYEARLKEGWIGVERWVAEEYDGPAAAESFRRLRGRG